MAPDALSSHPVKEPVQEDSLAEDHNPAPLIAEIRTHQTTAADNLHLLATGGCMTKNFTQLKATIFEGFPAHRRELPEILAGLAYLILTLEKGLMAADC